MQCFYSRPPAARDASRRIPSLLSRVLLPILLPLSLLWPLSAIAHRVIGIADGDTLTLLVNRHPLKIRLANIDAPEKSQPFGLVSKKSLSDLCRGKDAQYRPQAIDRYGRTVALVQCDGVEVSRAQIVRGMAWTYKRYNRDRTLPALQAAARKRRTGLWRGRRPVPPWEYRRQDLSGIRSGTKVSHAGCKIGPRGGRYQVINGNKRYGC